MPATAATDPGLTPHQRLMALAASVASTPADASIGLPYTYLHTQSWTRATNVMTRSDVRRWRRDSDSSGRELTSRLPDVPGLTHRPTPAEPSSFPAAPRKTTRYLPGQLQPYLAEPLPADATTLAGSLAPRELAAEPAYPRMLVHGVIGLSISQYLSQEQRAAILRVLARVPNIAFEGEQTDLAGRAGLGFSVTADGSTTHLILNRGTGEVLSAHEQVTGARAGLFSLVLILDRGRAATDTSTPSSRS